MSSACSTVDLSVVSTTEQRYVNLVTSVSVRVKLVSWGGVGTQLPVYVTEMALIGNADRSDILEHNHANM